MSRLIFKNSTMLQSNAAAAIGNQRQQCKAACYVVRRWKSVLQLSQKQPHAPKHAAASSFSQSEAGNSCGLLSTSSSVQTTSFFSSERVANFSTSSSKMSTSGKFLQLKNINPNFITMEYAVRGPLVIRAGEIENELEQGVKKPFQKVIRANIGDCQAMGQKPITFLRQLLALCTDTKLLESPDYPEDVKKRARIILGSCQGGSMGSYTESAGIAAIRQQVANHIEKRDGIPCDWQNIYLTAGATPGIKSCIALMNADVNGKKPGIMVPIPQYPLYSATIEEYGMERVGYYLEENKNWGLDRNELERAYNESKQKCEPRAIVVINPGNPTGQVLKRDNIVEIIKFAHENKLFLLADEVYQDNVYDKDSKFYSFKQVMTEMGAPYKDMELGSFMSASKGYLGECGIRGGYMELINLDPQVRAMLAKSLTASLCATSAGQIAISALVYPPQPDEPSYELYNCERSTVLNSLKERAKLVFKTLNSFEGFKVNIVQGAMYVFPQIEIPPKAVEAAKAKNMAPDTFYAFELLESTGICIIPGNGFGQTPGTYHFRTTILPQIELLKVMMEKFGQFHAEFMKKFK